MYSTANNNTFGTTGSTQVLPAALSTILEPVRQILHDSVLLHSFYSLTGQNNRTGVLQAVVRIARVLKRGNQFQKRNDLPQRLSAGSFALRLTTDMQSRFTNVRGNRHADHLGTVQDQ